jgi:hypothetical protein
METTNEQGGEVQPAVSGWAIVEVFGHRRLAGRVSEVTIAGAKMLRVDVPGLGARCPACLGEGTKARGRFGLRAACGQCQGSGKAATAGPDWIASPMFGGSAIFSITPATEAAVRAEVARRGPPPVEVDVPALPAAPTAATVSIEDAVDRYVEDWKQGEADAGQLSLDLVCRSVLGVWAEQATPEDLDRVKARIRANGFVPDAQTLDGLSVMYHEEAVGEADPIGGSVAVPEPPPAEKPPLDMPF